MVAHKSSLEISSPARPNLSPQLSDSQEVLGSLERDFELEESRFRLNINPDNEIMTKAFKLRADVYGKEMGFLDPDKIDQEEGIETDIYDKYSTHIVVEDDSGSVVGNMRLIHESEVDVLPVGHFFNIFVPEGSVEASRYISRTKDPKDQRAISIALIRAGTEQAIDADAPYIYMTIERDLYEMFINMGIPLEVVDDPKFIKEYNTTNMACRVNPRRVAAGILEADTLLKPSRKGTLRTRRTKLSPFFYNSSLSDIASGFSKSDLEARMRPFERNLGFLSKEDQEKIMSSRVSIAGTGGDGGMLALQLARLGVGSFKLADPEVFELENLNRQAASTYKTIGRNKAEVIAESILDINPSANIEVFTDGVQTGNVEEFVRGSDLVIDETEFTVPGIGVMIARESRKQGRPVLMALNVGYGCYVTSFDPEGYTFEDMMGIDKNAPLSEVADQEIPIERWVGHIPSYTDLRVLEKVSNGEMTAPSVAPGVAMAAGVASTQAIWRILGYKGRFADATAPNCLSFDAVDGFKLVKDTPEGFRQSIGRLAFNNSQ